MLYDKRWDRTEIKPDVFSLEGLIAWLEKQPAAGEYDYWSCNGFCLLDRYLGRTTTFSEYYALPISWKEDIASVEPFTFGAALDRARKALGERA